MYYGLLFLVSLFLTNFLSGCTAEPSNKAVAQIKKKNKQQATSDSEDGDGENEAEAEEESEKVVETTRPQKRAARLEEKPVVSRTRPSKPKPVAETVSESATDPARNRCKKLCETLSECRKSKEQSFCKWDQGSPACFSLYWTDSSHSDVCFFNPRQASNCKQDHPVQCGVVNTTIPGVVNAVDFLVQDEFLENSCKGLCSITGGCENSICRDSQTFPTCTGLYWKGNEVIHNPKKLTDDLKPVECGVIQYTHPKPEL
jgi:hypothetical protein